MYPRNGLGLSPMKAAPIGATVPEGDPFPPRIWKYSSVFWCLLSLEEDPLSSGSVFFSSLMDSSSMEEKKDHIRYTK